MNSFRRWILLALVGFMSLPSVVIADDFDDLTLKQYEEQLNAILKTRLDEEKEFIAKIVDLIEEDKLPRKVVDTSFKWVLNRRTGTNHPFVYFERVLRYQTKKLKIEIPAFDYSIYSERRAGR
jgi:hypothetical protein